MEQNDKIRLLLDMHEHPENYTDEQLAAMLNDELQEHLASAKRAMTDIPEPDVDAECASSKRILPQLETAVGSRLLRFSLV